MTPNLRFSNIFKTTQVTIDYMSDTNKKSFIFMKLFFIPTRLGILFFEIQILQKSLFNIL